MSYLLVVIGTVSALLAFLNYRDGESWRFDAVLALLNFMLAYQLVVRTL